MPRIDLHCHIFPERYRDQIPAGPRKLPGPDDLFVHMDRWGIDAGVIAVGGPLVGERSTPELAHLVNEGYAEFIAKHPSRLGGIASLPLPDVDASLRELEYALDVLHLDGLLPLTNYQGVYLGHPRLGPVFDAINQRAAYCFVHPDLPPTAALPHPGRWYDFPFDTTRAIVNLALSGTFDRYPRAKLQLAHLGGATPFIANRIHNQSVVMPNEIAGMTRGMSDYFDDQYYDTGLSAYYGNLATVAWSHQSRPHRIRHRLAPDRPPRPRRRSRARAERTGPRSGEGGLQECANFGPQPLWESSGTRQCNPIRQLR